MSNNKHYFHLVDVSPWPLLAGFSALSMTTGAVMYFHSYSGGGFLLPFGLFSLIYIMAIWWRDVIREGTYQGHHTKAVQDGLRIGVILFITSEVMFFFAFFWAFFASSLAPTLEIGATWPPEGIHVFDAFSVPLINTIILLSSGATVTWAHNAICAGNRKDAILGLGATIILAIMFTVLQGMEYIEAAFAISDGIYGSTFFLATGFHGLHVIIGTIFLTVCLWRLINYQFTTEHHFGFEAAAWYWHFVDVVWIFLYIWVYYWGGNSFVVYDKWVQSLSEFV